LQMLFKVVPFKAHLVTVCFQRYPALVTFYAFGPEFFN